MSTSLTDDCRCGAHIQHLVYKYLFNHPSASLKAAAKVLHVSYASARQAKSRYQRRANPNLRCPECFQPALRVEGCTSCGFEIDKPGLKFEADSKSQSPTHVIRPQGGLGTEVDYNKLGLCYGGNNIAHIVEKASDPLIERCKSDMWGKLKEVMPADGVVDEATKLLTREIAELRQKYPALAKSTKARSQLVVNVLKILSLRYPSLRKFVTL